MSMQFLRKVTQALRSVPGGIVFLEPVRRRHLACDESVRISDFDGDIKIELDLNEHMASQIFWYGSYSRDILMVLARLLTPGMVVFDVGANIGEISLFSAKHVGPSGKVYAFEPGLRLAHKLRHNVEINGYAQVEVLELAASAAPGSGFLYTSNGKFSDGSIHSGLATLYPHGTRVVSDGKVNITSVDAHCAQHRIERVDLMKVDVEGGELAVLCGAAKMIEQHRPWIVVEVQAETSQAAGYHHAEVLHFLAQYGYRFQKIARKGRLVEITVDTLEDYANVLCIPQKSLSKLGSSKSGSS